MPASKPEYVVTFCPDCGERHEVHKQLMGMSDWNLCPACDEAEHIRNVERLAGRGIIIAR